MENQPIHKKNVCSIGQVCNFWLGTWMPSQTYSTDFTVQFASKVKFDSFAVDVEESSPIGSRVADIKNSYQPWKLNGAVAKAMATWPMCVIRIFAYGAKWGMVPVYSYVQRPEFHPSVS